MPILAENVMETHVLTVSPETPLGDVQRLFVEEGIHGAPVVDDDGGVVGVVTTADLLRASEEERDTAVVDTDYFRSDLEFSGPDFASFPEDFQDRLSQRTVSEVMTREAVTVPRDMPVPRVAATLLQHRVHRVLVVDDQNALVGVVSSFDLLACLEKGGV